MAARLSQIMLALSLCLFCKHLRTLLGRFPVLAVCCLQDASMTSALNLQRLFLASAFSRFKWPKFQEPSLHGRSPMLQGSCISGKPKVVYVGQQRNFQSSTGSLRLEMALV